MPGQDWKLAVTGLSLATLGTGKKTRFLCPWYHLARLVQGRVETWKRGWDVRRERHPYVFSCLSVACACLGISVCLRVAVLLPQQAFPAPSS